MQWFRSNVLAGLVLAALLGAIGVALAFPGRLDDVERQAERNREQLELSVSAIRDRHAADVSNVLARQQSSEAAAALILQNVLLLQEQVGGLQSTVLAVTDAWVENRSARAAAPAEPAEGDRP